MRRVPNLTRQWNRRRSLRTPRLAQGTQNDPDKRPWSLDRGGLRRFPRANLNSRRHNIGSYPIAEAFSLKEVIGPLLSSTQDAPARSSTRTAEIPTDDKEPDPRSSMRFKWQDLRPLKTLRDSAPAFGVPRQQGSLSWPAVESVDESVNEQPPAKLMSNQRSASGSRSKKVRQGVNLADEAKAEREPAPIRRFPELFAGRRDLLRIKKQEERERREQDMRLQAKRKNAEEDAPQENTAWSGSPLEHAPAGKDEASAELQDVPGSGAPLGNAVLVSGVSANLQATDFTRLTAPALSNWGQQIDKIQQMHQEYTLDPLPSYELTFTSNTAAASYVAEIQRVQKLGAQYFEQGGKDHNSETKPQDDLASEADADTQTSLKSNTIAPATLRAMRVEHLPMSSRRSAWSTRLEHRLKIDQGQERYPLVIVDVYPPYGFNFRLSALEHPEDKRVLFKKVIPLQKVLRTHDAKPKAPEWLVERTQGRYIITCDSMDQARDIHHRWNGRVVTWPRHHFDGEADQDHILHTRILEW